MTEYPAESIDNLLNSGLCSMAILAKYSSYSIGSKDKKPSDEEVNDLFKSIDKVLHNIKDNRGKPLTGDSKACQDPEGLYKDICPCLKKIESAKTRFEKIEAIERAISTQHSTGYILDYGCPANGLKKERSDYLYFERILAKNLLDILFDAYGVTQEDYEH
jgi:hypothetical protein